MQGTRDSIVIVNYDYKGLNKLLLADVNFLG
jgi:hypothetical protein